MNVLNKNVQAGKNFEKIICVSGGGRHLLDTEE